MSFAPDTRLLPLLVDRRGRLAVRVNGLPYRARPESAIQGVVLHATPVDTSAESLALYQTTKVEGDPYPAIAYHFVVRADGGVEWCQDLSVETWHAGVQGSASHLAVCLTGAGGEEPLDSRQLDAARCLLAALAQHLGHELAIHAHRQLVPAVGCPGPRWRELAEALAPAGQRAEQALSDPLTDSPVAAGARAAKSAA